MSLFCRRTAQVRSFIQRPCPQKVSPYLLRRPEWNNSNGQSLHFMSWCCCGYNHEPGYNTWKQLLQLLFLLEFEFECLLAVHRKKIKVWSVFSDLYSLWSLGICTYSSSHIFSSLLIFFRFGRSCTDVLCCLIFMVVILAYGALGIVGESANAHTKKTSQVPGSFSHCHI